MGKPMGGGQIALFPDLVAAQRRPLVRQRFSHGGVCPDEARRALEARWGDLLEESDRFDRRLVSFQANKTERLHRWFKFREGFSAALVEQLMREFGLEAGHVLLDPFAGSGTTLLVAQLLGIHGVGIDLLPHNYLTWKVKADLFAYDLSALRALRQQVKEITPPPVSEPFPHLTITESAFPAETERDLMAYTRWCEQVDDPRLRRLCHFALLSILESISYTRKDGQYLRWDRRAEKVRRRNAQRIAQGKPPTRGIDKGRLPSVREALLRKLDQIIADVESLQREPPPPSEQRFIVGSTLYTLPTMEAESFDAVITSPPYANRYDYTRTYALELAYLGVKEEIFALRQAQLSCTVENRPKLDALARFYQERGEPEHYEAVMEIVHQTKALNEVNAALRLRAQRGDLNNRGVLTMIEQYFTELTFVFYELYRVCRRGAYVAVVNDNVRYGGEVIPVDLLSTELAYRVGFQPVKVYVLPQRKGNSSQQMGRFGREALRKSITLWRKE